MRRLSTFTGEKGLDLIATPHMASDTKEAIRRMDVVSAENVIRVLRGDPPLSAVNVVEKI